MKGKLITSTFFFTFAFTFTFTFTVSLLADELPLDDFIKHGDYLDIKISPQGDYFAARVRHNNSVWLKFLKRENGEIVGAVKPGPKNEIHTVTWVTNERVVYEIATKRVGFDRPIGTGELFSVNVDSSRHEMIYGYRAGDEKTGSRLSTKVDSKASQDVLSILENDKKNILIIEHPWVLEGNYYRDLRTRGAIISKLNIFSGRKKRVERLPYNNVTALSDKYGQVRFISWEEKNNTYKSAYRENNKKAWTPISTAFNVRDSLAPIEIDNVAENVYFKGQYGVNAVETIYQLNLKNGQLKSLFPEVKSDIVNWFNGVTTGSPVVAVSYPDKAKYHYHETDSRIARAHKKLTKAFAGQDVTLTSETRDGRLLLARVQSDINPGEYYLFDTEKNRAEFLLANRSWIDPSQMRPKKNLVIPARDGLKLNAYLTTPSINTEKVDTRPPLVVLVHGGPHGIRDYWAYDNETQLLANRGYAVLQVNFRGSGGYGLAFEKMGYREWGGKMIDDIVDATNWVVEKENIDSDRVCIYGASYGGYAALMSAARSPDTYKCAIGYVGVYDLELMYSKGDIPDFWGGEAYLEKVLGRDENQLKAFSPANHADKIKAAVMLIHGSEDDRVPIAHAKRMRKALKKAGKNVVWQIHPFSGHGVWDIKRRSMLYGDLLAFLEKNTVKLSSN